MSITDRLQYMLCISGLEKSSNDLVPTKTLAGTPQGPHSKKSPTGRQYALTGLHSANRMMMKAPLTRTSPTITLYSSRLKKIVSLIRKRSRQIEILQKQLPPNRPSCAYHPHFTLRVYCSSVRYTSCLPLPWKDCRIWKIIRVLAIISARTSVQSSHPIIRARLRIHMRRDVRRTAIMSREAVTHIKIGPTLRSGGIAIAFRGTVSILEPLGMLSYIIERRG